MIDQLRISGGFWKEQRRRRLKLLIRYSTKIKKELDEFKKSDMRMCTILE